MSKSRSTHSSSSWFAGMLQPGLGVLAPPALPALPALPAALPPLPALAPALPPLPPELVLPAAEPPLETTPPLLELPALEPPEPPCALLPAEPAVDVFRAGSTSAWQATIAPAPRTTLLTKKS